MEVSYADQAIAMLEKANADLEPQLLTVSQARSLLEVYTRAQRLAAFGVVALASRVDDASEIARVTGTSLGRARDTLATGKVLDESVELNSALQQGEVSLDQAAEIAKAEESCPGAATELIRVARDGSFHVLRDKARKVVLETEQHRDLGARQRAARSARSYTGELGMVDIHLRLQPHVGTPIVARAEAEAARLLKKAKGDGRKKEPLEAHLADAYARMLAGSGVKGRAKRPELVVLVSHEVAKRGWTDVRKGEICKVPGVGPVPPETAKEIGRDAFLNGVFYDGTDLRHLKRWSKYIPVEVAVALELGEPPGFDGVRCVDCGNRFRTEFDHAQPRSARGPTSLPNLGPKCWPCHQDKTKRDRKVGKLKPPDP